MLNLILENIRKTRTRISSCALVIRIRIARFYKRSDILRWSKKNVLNEEWNERTKLLSAYILPNASIIEFGAGNMYLRHCNHYYKSYVPSDIVKRCGETLVCDLNDELKIDMSDFDTVVFSGVLEYVYNIESVFDYLKTFEIRQIVMSYCPTDHNKTTRLENGWLSDYSISDLVAIFNVNGFVIKDESQWENQVLFNLVNSGLRSEQGH